MDEKQNEILDVTVEREGVKLCVSAEGVESISQAVELIGAVLDGESCCHEPFEISVSTMDFDELKRPYDDDCEPDPRNVEIPEEDYKRLCAERERMKNALKNVIGWVGGWCNLTKEDMPTLMAEAAKQNNLRMSNIISVCREGLGEQQ